MPAIFTGTIYCVAAFPSPWPPERLIRILKRAPTEGSLELWGLPDGSFLLALTPAGSDRHEIQFQRVRFVGGVRGILSVVWTDTTGSLRIGLREIKRASEANGEEAEIELSPAVPSRPPVDFVPRPGVEFTDQERLLFETVRDINGRVEEQPDHYSIIKAAGMLRLLFLDGLPLASQVNRRYRVPIEFEVVPVGGDLPLPADTHWCTIDPDEHPVMKSNRCQLDGFLGFRCLFHNGRSYTVHEIIDCCAHIMGGVHFVPAKTDEEKSLVELENALKFGGLSTADSAMKGIARVALRGLVPLLTAMCEGKRFE